MELGREDFIEHFKIVFSVHCLLRGWPKRRGRKRRDTPVAPSLVRESMLMANGALEGTAARFEAAVDPALLALDERTPAGQRPSMEAFAACIYDALDAAGLNVRIGPPRQAHGSLQPPTDPNAHLRYKHDVRVRLTQMRCKQALELMAREIAPGRHGTWDEGGYTIFSFATQAERDRFEAVSIEVVNGPELSWDQVVVRVGRAKLAP